MREQYMGKNPFQDDGKFVVSSKQIALIENKIEELFERVEIIEKQINCMEQKVRNEDK